MAKRVSDSEIARSVIADAPTEKLEGALNFINKLQEYNASKKLYDTYYTGVKKALDYNGNGKVYYDFRMEGTVTGRLSCAAYKCNDDSMGVSFHTLPRVPSDPNEVDIRSMFLPPKDWYFIAADYKTMELRVLAHLAQDPNMLQALRSGADLHKYTASLIYHIPVDQVTKEQRQIAKTVSFLIVYGGGAYRLSREARIPEDEAEEVIEGLRGAYPQVFTWAAEVEQFLLKNKYVLSMFGRRRHLDDIRSPNKSTRAKCVKQAGNFVIQSSASEITSFALLDIDMALQERALNSRIVASVHDSIEVVAPKDEVIEVLSIMKHRMTQYPYLKNEFGVELSVPLEIDVEVGKSFGGGGVEVHYNGFTVTNTEEVYGSIAT